MKKLVEDYSKGILQYKSIDNTMYYITPCRNVFRKLQNEDIKFRKPCLRKGFSGKLHARSIPVVQYSLDGTFVKEWESMNLASEEGFLHGGISKCCTGKVKQHRNYVWRYKSKKL